MPVVTAIERGRQLSRWSDVGIAIQTVTQFVRIFFVHASQCQIRKPLSRADIKHGWSSRLLRVSRAHTEEQKNDKPKKAERQNEKPTKPIESAFHLLVL